MAGSMIEESEIKATDVVIEEEAARLEFEEYRTELRNITNELFIEPLRVAIKQKDEAIDNRFINLDRRITDLSDLSKALDRKSDDTKKFLEIGLINVDKTFESMRNEHEKRFKQFELESFSRIKNLNVIGITALIMGSLIVALQLYIIFAK